MAKPVVVRRAKKNSHVFSVLALVFLILAVIFFVVAFVVTIQKESKNDIIRPNIHDTTQQSGQLQKRKSLLHHKEKFEI